MRAAFVATLTEIAGGNDKVLLLTGDLGFNALEPFSQRFPHRFFNVGVAEQNLIGLATGLAESGFVPFCYSIATFASMRGYEFIRNGPVAHGLPVRLVGIGGGFEYGPAGPTHHALEDIGLLRLQPGLTVLTPADPDQTKAMVLATWDSPGPIYYRIGKDDRTFVPDLDGRFELGRSELVRDGKDVLILAMGAMSAETVAAADELRSDGIDAAVAVVSTLSPAPIEDLVSRLRDHGNVITVESHYVVGGLGSLVSELIAEHSLRCRLQRLGVRERLDSRSGSTGFLNERHGLSKAAIVECARRAAT